MTGGRTVRDALREVNMSQIKLSIEITLRQQQKDIRIFHDCVKTIAWIFIDYKYYDLFSEHSYNLPTDKSTSQTSVIYSHFVL